jgi:hypothetical protein
VSEFVIIGIIGVRGISLPISGVGCADSIYLRSASPAFFTSIERSLCACSSKESIKKQKNAKRSVYKYFMSINVMLN